MPALDEIEIRELIENGSITAITLDTTEFHHLGYQFNSKLLSSLVQFRDTNISVVFSEITIEEVISHVAENIKASAEKVRSAIRGFNKCSASSFDVDAVLDSMQINTDPKARAKEMVDRFIKDVGAKIIPFDTNVQVSDLVSLYVKQLPPFSSKSDKKHEFPDAIALLSLEAWIRSEGKTLLAVSADRDWSQFAAQSDHIACIEQTAPALNLFNREDSVFVARVAAGIRSGSALHMQTAIKDRLETLIEIFEIEANAPFSYDEEAGISQLIAWTLADDASFDVVTSDYDSVTFSCNVVMTARFEASFAFYIRDSIDRDYVVIGGRDITVERDIDVQLVIAVHRTDENNPEVLEIESESWGVRVDFGYVEPNYDRD